MLKIRNLQSPYSYTPIKNQFEVETDGYKIFVSYSTVIAAVSKKTGKTYVNSSFKQECKNTKIRNCRVATATTRKWLSFWSREVGKSVEDFKSSETISSNPSLSKYVRDSEYEANCRLKPTSPWYAW